MKNKIDWKEKLDELNMMIGQIHIGAIEGDIREEIIKFTELACVEQKKICAENATVELNADSDGCLGFYDEGKSLIYADLDQYSDFGIFPQKSSILNSPTVKFE